MRNDKKIDVSFSASAEDVIRRFMKVGGANHAKRKLSPSFTWWVEGTFTDKVPGKVTKLGPRIDVGAIDSKKLTRSPTHKSHPDAGCGKFDEGQVICIVFFEARCDGSEMLEFVEETFDQITAIEEVAERGNVDAPRHGFDVGPCAARGQSAAQGVAIRRGRRAGSGPGRYHPASRRRFCHHGPGLR
jgi:hypothetical protein